MKQYRLAAIIGTTVSSVCWGVSAAQLIPNNSTVKLVNRTQASLHVTIGTDDDDASCTTVKNDGNPYAFSAEALQGATRITLVCAGRARIIAIWEALGQTLIITEKDFSGKKQGEQELLEKS